jgi:hypothetical protein
LSSLPGLPDPEEALPKLPDPEDRDDSEDFFNFRKILF